MLVAEGLAPVRDRILSFAVPARDVRGRIVRLDASVNAILAAHDYPPALARLLGEALAVTAMLGATLRETGGGLTLQAQADGGISLLVCDYNAGQLRGYVRGDAATPFGDLETMFGSGHLAITLDQTAASERYQGIVPLEGASIADAIEQYFRSSEQLPTLIRTAMSGDASTGYSVGGLLLQYLPRGEEGRARLFAEDDGAPEPEDWQHMRTLAATVTADELTDTALTEESLLWRLFHEEEVRLQPGPVPSRGCRCSLAHIRDVIERFPEAERAEMRGEDGMIGVDCQFCSRVWKIAA
ncbi:MAG: molecular chaperone Hsp33 [Alphaproteobacteria bacterium PA4]|nr:MAG: molecular chaperone Hsp33 [Alphaproteobacteria bacterium PA4]